MSVGMKLASTSLHVSDPNVGAIRSGDVAAFERLYRAHYHPLLGYLVGIVSSAAIAEEIYQDLFLTIWCKRRTWYPRGSVKSYLYKAARNRAIDYLRRQKVEANWVQHQAATGKGFVDGPDSDLPAAPCMGPPDMGHAMMNPSTNS